MGIENMESGMNAMMRIEADRPALSLDIPKGTSFEDWVGIGRQLCASSQVVNWYIGDWWAAGSHRYGARAQTAAEGIFGQQFGALMNMASVCRAFETSRRHEVLSFSHHQEVAALPPQQADALLRQAATEGWSTRGLRKAVMSARSPSAKRIVDVIDVRGPEPVCVDFLTPDEIIVELAEALSRERALTDRESLFWEKAEKRIQQASGDRVTEPWTGEQDLTVITMVKAGTRIKEIVPVLERTEDAIWSRVRYLRRKGLLERPMATQPVGE